MNIAAVCGLAVVGLAAVLILRSLRPEYAVIAGIVTGVILLSAALTAFAPMVKDMRELADGTSFSLYISVILKALGIGILAQSTADICRDSGEGAIANKVEFSAKILILLLCLPILQSLLALVSDFLG